MKRIFNLQKKTKRKIYVLIRFEDYSNVYEIEMHATETSIFHCVQDILDEGFTVIAIEEIKK